MSEENQMMHLKMLEARIENMMKQREMLANRIAEIDATSAGIEEASKAKGDVLFHIGGEAFMHARPSNEGKVIVMIGAEVALEKSAEDAVKILGDRKVEANNILGQIQKEIENSAKELESLAAGMDHGHEH
jgi:prefoldin alpha subunit